MGFKPWRNLGVLALAGASLVGCTTPQTTKLVAPTPPANSWNTPAGQVPPPPNPNVFGAQQQFAPNANGGFDNQQRQTVQGGFPQAGGPANPNNGFNTSSGPQNYNGNNYPAQNSPPPSSPANSYITAPNGSTQQPYNNPGFQANPGNVGPTGAQNPYAFPQGGAATPGLPQPPTGFSPPNPGGVMPIPPPTNFGVGGR